MIVDCAVYENGKRRPEQLAIEGALDAVGPDAFVWLGLYEPTAAEFERVSAEFGLHELVVEDVVTAHQRPKLEVYDDVLLVVLKSARYDDDEEEVEFGEVLVLVGEHFVVIVRHGRASSLTPVRRGLEMRPDLLGLGPSAVLHAVMDRIVDDYLPVVDGLAEDIDEVERQVFSPAGSNPAGSNPAERIYFLKREVLQFRQSAGSLIEPLHRLVSGAVPMIAEDTREYFRDVLDHALRVVGQVEQFRDLLTSVLEANLTQVGIRQNEDMRKISAWVAVGVVPTLIAGVYGMNFTWIPGLDASWGFPVAVAVMGGVAATLYGLFRRSGWL